MSYKSALIAAGAEVLEFKSFGQYSGTWYANVKYEGEILSLGVTGWTSGWYGSCDLCDSFEGEFGYDDDEKPDYQERLADFGRGYLTVMPAAHFLAPLDEQSEWDGEAEDAAEWIRKIEGNV